MPAPAERLGLLLSTGPEHPNLAAALGLAEAALARGTECYLYLIDDGVRTLADPRVGALPARGVRLFACAYGCQRRGIPLDAGGHVTYCGLVVLTDLLDNTDRFIALN
jgi:sulfur relay (sulfurtransferase) complex TusBCD TusD component (DsrE family)